MSAEHPRPARNIHSRRSALLLIPLVILVLVVAIVVARKPRAPQHIQAINSPTLTTLETTSTASMPTTIETTTTVETITVPPVRSPTTIQDGPAVRPPPPPPDPGTGVHRGAYGPRPSDSTSFPYEQGHTSWTHEANGVSLTVEVLTADPHVDQPVQIRMTATDSSASCCGLHFLFGDGGNYSYGTSATCATLPPPGTVVKEFSHTWNQAGRWEFLSQGFSRATDCSSNTNYVSIYAWITISP